MRPSLRSFALATAVALAAAGTAQAQTLVYGLEEGSSVNLSCSAHDCYPPTAVLINAATGHTIASIPTAAFLTGSPTPRGTSIRSSSDGLRLFVTIGAFNSPSASGRLAVLDTVSKTVLATITVGAAPSGVAVLPDNSRAYVVNSGGNSVSVIDLASFTVVATVPVQTAPARIAVTPDGSAVYVTNTISGTVSKISTSSNTVETTITVGSGPDGIDISPDGQRLFTANTGSQTVSVIDATSDTLLRNLAAGSGTQRPIRVAAQSASRVFVALADSAGTNHVVEQLDAVSGMVQGSSTIGSPVALARDSNGSLAYVVDSAALELAASDASSTTIVATHTRAWGDATVVTDPCAFEASAAPSFFGPAGGDGTITIPAPVGCSWTVDPSPVPGLTLTSSAGGTGPGTVTFTYGAATSASRAAINIGRQGLRIVRTIPRMNVDFAGGATVQEPFVIGGWAFVNAVPLTTAAVIDSHVDAVHVWAFPTSGGPPVFVGTAAVRLYRPDVGAAFGLEGVASGFQISVGSLPSGTYWLTFYAHNSVSGQFDDSQAVLVTVHQALPTITVETPSPNANVRSPFAIGGWAIDPVGPAGGPGIDAVHVWAYPVSGAPPVFIGAASYGVSRPDVAAAFGSRFTASGFTITASLPPGGYTLAIFARSLATLQFAAQTVPVAVLGSDPRMNVDIPSPGAVGGVFPVSGWAVDLGAGSGAGVDAVHIWAFPATGAAPVFVGVATFGARPDVGAVFGSQFTNSGFTFGAVLLTSGTYDLVVYAHSTVTGTFNDARVIRITVP